MVSRRNKLLLAISAICLLKKAKNRRRKPRSCWTRSWIERRCNLGLSCTLVRELQREDTSEFRAMFRMDKESFDCLLNMIKQTVEREDTLMRQSISAEDRLNVTLRYLATG
jgi:hypothetical protein